MVFNLNKSLQAFTRVQVYLVFLERKKPHRIYISIHKTVCILSNIVTLGITHQIYNIAYGLYGAFGGFVMLELLENISPLALYGRTNNKIMALEQYEAE